MAPVYIFLRNILKSHLTTQLNYRNKSALFARHLSNSFPSVPDAYPYDITIGNTSTTIKSPPKNPSLIQSLRVNRFVSNTDLAHLEWIMKKEALRQDMFLIGPPSGYKRRLLSLYSYLFGREMEIIQISRDTTEADIKQIREVKDKSVVYHDQASVRAALNGFILVLDGIEKAERNVLPLLNNLLENREMHLEDGRHLLPHWRYDELVKLYGSESVKSWKLERVHPDFRVIALGLPVPAFKGNPLDPPLRSRFQGRNVGSGFARDEVYDYLIKECCNGDESKKLADTVRKMVDLAFGINYLNSREFKEKIKKLDDGNQQLHGQRPSRRNKTTTDVRVGEDVPYFVTDSLFDGVRILKNLSESKSSFFDGILTKSRYSTLLPLIFRLMYPFDSKKVENLLTEQLGEQSSSSLSSSVVSNIIPSNVISKLNDPAPLQSQLPTLSLLFEFLRLPGETQRAPLLYGRQGCGKSTIANYLHELFEKQLYTIQIYKDMSTRDLFQVRSTDKDGNTIWIPSQLVKCAEQGGICVLDGVENLHESVFGVIGALVREREVRLPDGINILRAHPDFKLVGVADSSDLKLSPEISSTFFVFDVAMGTQDELEVCGGGKEVQRILGVLQELRERSERGDKSCESLSRNLSVTQIKRIGRRVEGRRNALGKKKGEEINVFDDVYNSVFGQFLPIIERDLIVDIMQKHGIIKEKHLPEETTVEKSISVFDNGKKFKIGRIEGEVVEEKEEFNAKIPKGGVFFDIGEHVKLLESLADDFINGNDHLLVVGNQGVGKNKIIDRMLEIIGRGREYIQLHRDTTVHSLTTNQKIEDGIIKVQDSPLVNAARHGLVLVIDEADKAPAHVTAILKTLAERGEMVLGDGRRILRNLSKTEGESYTANADTKGDIRLHPNFRMIVLANRPGFPFLGNSFYGSLSHLFSVNPVNNPGLESEVQLLKGYGPDVAEVEKVAGVFKQLRELSDDGTLAYPYSTREAVHVVKHLAAYPKDVTTGFSNVFDFDWWDDESFSLVRDVVEREFGRGVLETMSGVKGAGKDGEGGNLVLKIEGKKFGGEGGASSRTDFSKFGDPKEGKFDATGSPHVGGNTWAGGSGGMSTAGLGGVGGPYRLTDGNTVFQVSPEAKAAVPPEVLEKARELNRKLYEEKLAQLRMSPHDNQVYNEFLMPILPQVKVLKNILNSLQAKSDERKWVRHQTTGDLDDNKLVEGLIGEQNVYRSRMDKKPEVGDPQMKPKLVRLLVDASGSMYRFNGMDGRLERVMSCVLMVMEAFASSELVDYQVYAHSGETDGLELVGKDKSGVKDEKGRFLVLKELFLHSQFCASGDHTLEATYNSLEELEKIKDDYDEIILVVLSDANLERYGISAKEFGRVLSGSALKGNRNDEDSKVKGYSVFIGSIGDQAEVLKEQLPVGKSFVCMNVAELPKILDRIFRIGVLK